MRRALWLSLCLAVTVTAGWQTGGVSRVLAASGRAAPGIVMGRAEKRAAAKRKKKGGSSSPARVASTDKLPQSVLEARLREIPVFGLLREGEGFASQGGETLYYLDAREAERQCAANPGFRVEGVALGSVYFEGGTRLKPCDDALRELSLVPADRTLVPAASIRTPLFCIDGFQTANKDTNVNSLPLFLSRKDLLEFAASVYGGEAAAAEKVLCTDLAVVVDNMLVGPAGLLRDASFFADAKALQAMDRLQESGGAAALFPDTPSGGLFDTSFKLPWQ
jgi:hypothetical protein